MVKGQMKIQQMAFMIIALFIFFTLGGLFLLQLYTANLKGAVQEQETKKTLQNIQTITNMNELRCNNKKTYCINEDKLRIMSSTLQKEYENYWNAESIKVYKIYPAEKEKIPCPGTNCNYYEIYNSGQKETQEYSTFINICKTTKENNYAYEECSIGKIVVGTRIIT
jgi:hypothetical protein